MNKYYYVCVILSGILQSNKWYLLETLDTEYIFPIDGIIENFSSTAEEKKTKVLIYFNKKSIKTLNGKKVQKGDTISFAGLKGRTGTNFCCEFLYKCVVTYD